MAKNVAIYNQRNATEYPWDAAAKTLLQEAGWDVETVVGSLLAQDWANVGILVVGDATTSGSPAFTQHPDGASLNGYPVDIVSLCGSTARYQLGLSGGNGTTSSFLFDRQSGGGVRAIYETPYLARITQGTGVGQSGTLSSITSGSVVEYRAGTSTTLNRVVRRTYNGYLRYFFGFFRFEVAIRTGERDMAELFKSYARMALPSAQVDVPLLGKPSAVLVTDSDVIVSRVAAPTLLGPPQALPSVNRNILYLHDTFLGTDEWYEDVVGFFQKNGWKVEVESYSSSTAATTFMAALDAIDFTRYSFVVLGRSGSTTASNWVLRTLPVPLVSFSVYHHRYSFGLTAAWSSIPASGNHYRVSADERSKYQVLEAEPLSILAPSGQRPSIDKYVNDGFNSLITETELPTGQPVTFIAYYPLKSGSKELDEVVTEYTFGTPVVNGVSIYSATLLGTAKVEGIVTVSSKVTGSAILGQAVAGGFIEPKMSPTLASAALPRAPAVHGLIPYARQRIRVAYNLRGSETLRAHDIAIIDHFEAQGDTVTVFTDSDIQGFYSGTWSIGHPYLQDNFELFVVGSPLSASLTHPDSNLRRIQLPTICMCSRTATERLGWAWSSNTSARTNVSSLVRHSDSLSDHRSPVATIAIEWQTVYTVTSPYTSSVRRMYTGGGTTYFAVLSSIEPTPVAGSGIVEKVFFGFTNLGSEGSDLWKLFDEYAYGYPFHIRDSRWYNYVDRPSAGPLLAATTSEVWITTASRHIEAPTLLATATAVGRREPTALITAAPLMGSNSSPQAIGTPLGGVRILYVRRHNFGAAPNAWDTDNIDRLAANGYLVTDIYETTRYYKDPEHPDAGDLVKELTAIYDAVEQAQDSWDRFDLIYISGMGAHGVDFGGYGGAETTIDALAPFENDPTRSLENIPLPIVAADYRVSRFVFEHATSAQWQYSTVTTNGPAEIWQPTPVSRWPYPVIDMSANYTRTMDMRFITSKVIAWYRSNLRNDASTHPITESLGENGYSRIHWGYSKHTELPADLTGLLDSIIGYTKEQPDAAASYFRTSASSPLSSPTVYASLPEYGDPITFEAVAATLLGTAQSVGSPVEVGVLRFSVLGAPQLNEPFWGAEPAVKKENWLATTVQTEDIDETGSRFVRVFSLADNEFTLLPPPAEEDLPLATCWEGRWSPDGRYYAVVSNSSTRGLFIYDYASSPPTLLPQFLPEPGPCVCVRWSRSGKWLAVGRSGTVYPRMLLYRMEHGRIREVKGYHASTAMVRSIDFHPSNKFLVTGQNTTTWGKLDLFSWDDETGDLELIHSMGTEWNAPNGPVSAVRFSQDGTMLAVGSTSTSTVRTGMLVVYDFIPSTTNSFSIGILGSEYTDAQYNPPYLVQSGAIAWSPRVDHSPWTDSNSVYTLGVGSSGNSSIPGFELYQIAPNSGARFLSKRIGHIAGIFPVPQSPVYLQNAAYGVSWDAEGKYLAYCAGGAPRVMIYDWDKWQNGGWTADDDSVVAITGASLPTWPQSLDFRFTESMPRGSIASAQEFLQSKSVYQAYKADANMYDPMGQDHVFDTGSEVEIVPVATPHEFSQEEFAAVEVEHEFRVRAMVSSTHAFRVPQTKPVSGVYTLSAGTSQTVSRFYEAVTQRTPIAVALVYEARVPNAVKVSREYWARAGSFIPVSQPYAAPYSMGGELVPVSRGHAFSYSGTVLFSKAHDFPAYFMEPVSTDLQLIADLPDKDTVASRYRAVYTIEGPQTGVEEVDWAVFHNSNGP